MARFDVYEYADEATPLALDVQADLLSGLNTCMVVPLRLKAEGSKDAGFERLRPLVDIEGKTYVLITDYAGAIRRDELGRRVGNIEDDYREEVIDALDFLFQGF